MLDETLAIESLIEDLDASEGDTLLFDQACDRFVIASESVEEYGATPSVMAMLKATHLLSSTALDKVGQESFSKRNDEAAMEALWSDIQNDAGKWAAKIVSSVKTASQKTLTILTPLLEKIGTLLKKAGTAAWDGTKALARTAKAHPVETILTILGAIAATGALLAYSGTNLPGAMISRQAMAAFGQTFNKMVGAIKWPFGKIEAGLTKIGVIKLKIPEVEAATVESVTLL